MPTRKRARLRWLIWTVIGLTALLAAAYGHLTNPARLRTKALEALQALRVDGIDIGQVTFSPWDGLQLSDLVVAPQSSGSLYQRVNGVQTPPLLHIGSARIDCGLRELLSGRVRPTDIALRHVAVAVVCNPARAAGDAVGDQTEAGVRLLEGLLSAVRGPLPRVTIAQADLQVMVVEGGRPRLVQRLLLHAEGQATPAGYNLRVDRRPSEDEPLAVLQWNNRTGELELALGSADLKTVARLVPPRVAEALKRLDMAGRVRVDRLVIRRGLVSPGGWEPGRKGEAAAQLAAAELRLADVRCVLPLEDDRTRPAAAAADRRPADCFLQMTDGAATLTFRRADPHAGGELEVRADARLRGAPATFSLSMDASPVKRLWTADEIATADSRARAAFSLDDVRQAELRVEGLELPTAETYPAFIRSPRLTGGVVAAFEHYEPRGKVNLRLRVLPSETLGGEGAPLAGTARIEGEIEALGAACRYYLFPYDLEDAWGYVRLSRGRILLDNLCGRHGASRVCANGVVNNSHPWTGFDLTFRGRNVTLDGDLYAALPASYRRLWQRAAPLGLCDVVTTVRRADGSAETGPLKSDVHVEAHLLGGSLSLGDRQRLDHADGWLTVDGGVVHVRNLHGYDGDSTVRLDGSVRVVDGAAHSDLRVAVSDLPIEHQAALAPGSTDSVPQMRFVGRADVWGRVWGSEQSGGREQHFAVHLKDGELRGLDPTRGWTVSDGWVSVRGGKPELVSFTCRQGDARLDVAGTLPAAAQPGEGMALELHANTPTVGELYPQFLPDNWAKLADTLGLTGPSDVTVRLRPAEGDPTTAGQAAEIKLHASRMKAQPMPLDLRNVTAHLTLAPGRFRLSQAGAQWGEEGAIEARQKEDGTWQSGNVQAEFDITARRMVFGPELIAALPKPLARLLERLSLRGGFDAFLPRVRVSGSERRTWRLEGSLSLRDAALRVGLDLTGLDGQLSGVCSVEPGSEVELDARFAIERGQLANRPIEHWDGELLHQPGQRWVRLENLHGRLCDGVAQGSLRIDPQTSEYELALKLHDVTAAQLLPPPKDHPDRPRRGRIDGDIWLRGKGDDVGSRQGGGNLRITGASFLQTPVLAAVFRQREKHAISDTVDRARLRFLWSGREVRLKRIDIQSQDLRLVGEGTWDLRDDTIHMTLWGAHPEHWPRVAVLSDLLESAGQELVQYRVGGTLAAPQVTAEPLSKLSEALRRLLGEGGNSE